MKSFTTSLLLMITLLGCRKDFDTVVDGYLSNVQTSLKDSIGSSEYAQLNFSKAVRTQIGGKDWYYLRVPQVGVPLGKGFLLLKTKRDGGVMEGRWVALNKDAASIQGTFSGRIQVRSLEGALLLDAPIEKGRFKSSRPYSFTMGIQALHPDPYRLMPEVIVVATREADAGYTYSDWISLQSLFNDSGVESTGYYSPMDENIVYGGGGYSGGGDSGTGDPEGSVYADPTIIVDLESDREKPAIDIIKFINCFNAIPDAGSTCTIEIFADIPVDSNPNKLFDVGTQFPGHAFIQIKKSNGNQSAIQNIGFYPKTDWKSTLTTAPIEGKLVDNGGHEFNASLKMSVTPENFKSILTEILYLTRFIKYDIDEYNCTDFALDVFNKVRVPKLEIPLYAIPGGITAGGTRTPQGLYNQLKQMKLSGSPEAKNITIGDLKNWVANSTGPCN